MSTPDVHAAIRFSKENTCHSTVRIVLEQPSQHS